MADIKMPKLSDTMTEGTLVAWKKKTGDTVTMGEVIAEVETDKATMEMEAFEDGVITEIFVKEGQKVAIGERIARIGDDVSGGGSAPASEKDAAPQEKPSEPTAPPAATAKSSPEDAPQPPRGEAPSTDVPVEGDGARVKASPLARKLAAEHGVNLTGLRGSGPGGRIIQRDVLAATQGDTPAVPAAQPAAAQAKAPTASASQPQPVASAPAAKTSPKAAAQDQKTPLSSMRKTIADRLLQSKTTIPHFYLHIEVDAGPLTKLRAELNAAGGEEGIKFSVNDFILKAAVAAAVRVPKVNASFTGDSITQFASINLAVAVAVDEGLITPVIRDAQTKSLRDISAAVKDLATRARARKLKPDEYQGGTLTVSNLGGFGIDRFDAIINPPQSIILSVGALVKKPVVNKNDEIVVGHRIDFGLSCDHRVVDGAIGADYLAALRKLIEQPALMLV